MEIWKGDEVEGGREGGREGGKGEVCSTCDELRANGKRGHLLEPEIPCIRRILCLTISDLLSQIAVNHVIRPDAAAHLQRHLLLPGRRL